MGKKSKRRGKSGNGNSTSASRGPVMIAPSDALRHPPSKEELMEAMNNLYVDSEPVSKDDMLEECDREIKRMRARELLLAEYVPFMAAVCRIDESEVESLVQADDRDITEKFRKIAMDFLPLVSKQKGLSECQCARLMKACSIELVERMRSSINRTTPAGKVEHERNLAFGHHNRFQHLTSALNDDLKDFLLRNPSDSAVYPAVDLASGCGVYAVEYSRHYRPPAFGAALEWYPTEQDDPKMMKILHDGIDFMKQEAESASFLFSDVNDMPVHSESRVTLFGLSKQEFNGLLGTVLGPDPKNEGRYAVQLDGRPRPLSFKASAIVLVADGEADDSNIQGLTKLDVPMINGLKQRARVLDIQKRDTWTNVEKLYGKCAVVTCTVLLICCGYREPLMWQDALELASKLLAPGGLFLQYDTEKYGGFADVKKMKKFVAIKSLGLKLKVRSEPVQYYDDDGRMFIVVWQKEEN